MLARQGVYEIGGGSGREYKTVLGCVSADGIKLPPFVVCKAKNGGDRQGVGLLLLDKVCQTVVGGRQFL